MLRCCFAGHRGYYDKAKREMIKRVAEDMILNYDVKSFWVGNYGDFDRCSAEAVRELKKKYKHIKLELIIPYLTKIINENKEEFYKSYDAILIADMPLSTPKQLQIIKTNQYMVDNSDILICSAERKFGGAAKTVEYARRKGKKIINIE